MKQYEPLDPNSPRDEKKILMTNRLLAISLTIYAMTFVIYVFQDQFGISNSIHLRLISVLATTALGLNIAGLIKGILERKIDSEMAANGIIGNLIPIIIALVCLCIVLYFFSKIGELDLNFNIPKKNPSS